jgi:spore germination protein YaaH
MSIRSKNPLELVFESRLGGVVINLILIPLLILSALMLPPISLADRLLSVGYERIGRDGGAVQDPDGTQVIFVPEGVNRSFRVKISAVPRSMFLEGSAGNNLLIAAENIPPNLVMKSPFYRLQIKGTEPNQIVLRIPIPNESEPYSTLDLYSWTGDAWEWVPSQVIVEEDVMEAELDFIPTSVAAMQTHPVSPYISADYAPNAFVPEGAADMLAEVNPAGLYLETDGQIIGEPAPLPPELQSGALTVIPTIRNWYDDGSIRSDLVDNMLIDPDVRELHVQSILDLIDRNGYPGIDIDYRGISPQLRSQYTDFLTKLREGMTEDKQLLVRVEAPAPISADTWETGAYDWRAIGRVANVVKIPTSPDPRAYVPEGQMESMLNWAVGEVNRYKIQLLLSTRSTLQANGITKDVSYQDALSPLGAVSIIGGENIVPPGQQVDFTLNGLQASTGIQFDENSGAYWFAYLDSNNVQHTVYIENAASIARKLQYVAQYNLRGVAIHNLLNQDNDSQVWSVVRKFVDLVIPPVENNFNVVWRVRNQDGGVIAEEVVALSNPNYRWTAPEAGGSYEVVAAISSDQTSGAMDRGAVAVLVATPTPIPTPTPQPTPTPEPSPTPEPTAEPEEEEAPEPAPQQQQAPAQEQAPAPALPAVSSSVGNLPFDYGIQVDPRGNTANNIAMIKGMGFNWVKFQMAWKNVEPAPGSYSWGMWDEIINAYSSNGIKILLSIPKAPDWARPPDDDKSVEGPPQDPIKYAEFVGRVADRYRGKVQAIEVWNEQNLYYEAGGQGRVNPANYVELLKLSYTAIKSVNPDMIVVSGALTPTGAPPPAAMDDLEYLRQMYGLGAKDYFDAVGAHPSGFANAPDALFQGGDFDPARGYDDHRSFFFRNTMEEYRRIMVENGDGNKTIWPTEFGWPVWRFTGDERFVFAKENSVQQQAAYTVRAYQMGKEWGWVGTMFLWNLDYNLTAGATELANFGIAGTPTYDALAGMAK